MENADLARIINSDEVQSVLRAKLEAPKKYGCKKNPLKNKTVMARVNPGILDRRLERKREHEDGTKEHELAQKRQKNRATASKEHNKEHKKGDETFYKTLMKAFETKAKAAKKGDSSDAGDDAEDDE